MEFIFNLTVQTIGQVLFTLTRNWPFLVVSVLIATALKLYIRADVVSAFLMRHRKAGVLAATTAAVTTPLCSCGTTAIVLGMMASMMPWAPVVAFMVSSPLSSPEELVYSAGLFGWPFAIAFFLASIFLGLAGGGLAAVLENRGLLANQARYNPTAAPAAQPAQPTRIYSLETDMPSQPEMLRVPAPAASEKPAAKTTPDAAAKVTPAVFAKELFTAGKRLLFMFLGFAFIGYFLNGLIPQAWVPTLFGQGNIYSVPLAATLGLPLYINTEASLPLIRALIDGGMSQGAALAFMVSGAGTSIGAIVGAMTIARWRVVALVVGVLWLGAILTGYAYNLYLAF